MTVKKSSHTEDIHKHVDYWLAHNKMGRWGVDVKGNNLPDEIWVELMNVQGNPGWLYGGAKIIAFDMPEEGGFSIVDRVDLLHYTEAELVDARDRGPTSETPTNRSIAGGTASISSLNLTCTTSES